MVDRRPQDFPNGTPDGATDNTAAIQAAIDAWQPGDLLILSGGTFRISSPLLIGQDSLLLTGDGTIRALPGFPASSTMFEVTGSGVTFDTDGLELDQAGVMAGGSGIRANAAVGLQILSVVSRGTQGAFLRIESGTTDLLLAGCDHVGEGHGVLAFDPFGLTRLTFRDCRFEHVGSGAPGAAVLLDCATSGASFVDVIGCTAIGYVGEAESSGIGFGFARVTDGRLIGCRAERCEGDAFHLENGANRWVCADLIARDIGVSDPVGNNGSGLIAYDCDDIAVVLMLAKNCAYHGIALTGEGSLTQRVNGVIERCTVDGTGRDGIHVTAQKDFRIDRNWVRDPASGNAGLSAGIHVARQGDTTLENVDGTGVGNVVVLSGATQPLGEIVVRPQSVNVVIDGIGEAEIRLTEQGDARVTEDGRLRALEIG